MANSIEQKNPDIKLNRKGNRRGIHPNSLKNLRPVKWQKGESGNPAGTSLRAELVRLLNQPLTKPKADDPAKILFLYAMLVDSIGRHDKDARKEIWERAEGKVKEPVELSGEMKVKMEVIKIDPSTIKEALAALMESGVIKGSAAPGD